MMAEGRQYPVGCVAVILRRQRRRAIMMAEGRRCRKGGVAAGATSPRQRKRAMMMAEGRRCREGGVAAGAVGVAAVARRRASLPAQQVMAHATLPPIADGKAA